MKIKNILFAVAIVIGLLNGCKYDDSYLDATIGYTMTYFASNSHTRTVIPGEGLYFGVGPAMAGVIENPNDQTVDIVFPRNEFPSSYNRTLMPANYISNFSELSSVVKVTIPKGRFLGLHTVVLDSVAFLNDPAALNATYAIPIKIVGTSLDSINAARDSILITVRYQSTYEGYYFFKNSTITPEHGGTMFPSRTESYTNESNNSCWTLTTLEPFKVRAVSAVNAFTQSLQFDLSVTRDGTVTYDISEAPNQTVEPEAGKENKYDSKTRDFTLNFKYVKPENNDTTYHVSTTLYFRNRIVDNIMQTREYLMHYNQ